MANRIVHKSNSVAGVVPALVNITYGEIAINIVDGLIFLRKQNDTIIKIGADNQPLVWKVPTLVNGWIQYSATWSIRYAQDSSGIVHIKGRVKNGNRNTDNAIFTLPVGMRPSSAISFNVSTYGGFGEITITSNGVVTYVGTNSVGLANTFLSVTAMFKGEI